MANSNPKVLIAAGIYPPDAGGPATHAKAQFEGFPKFGINTGLVAFAHYRKWPFLIRHALYFIALLTKVPKFDLVYAHDAVGAGIPALIAAKIFGKKFVVRIGGDLAWERHAERENLSMMEWYEKGLHKQDLLYYLSRFLMRRSDLIVVISQSLAEAYIRFYGIKRENFKVILNPIPKNEVPEGPVEKEKTIIFASRLTSYKNLDMAFRVLARIFPSHPDLKFVVMGDGPEMENLKSLCEELGIHDNVSILGSASHAEVVRRTASCLFTIAPALTEFNPNYVLQGIAFGKPFLISRGHGLPFEVPDMLLLSPGNENEFRSKIERLLTEDGYDEAVRFVNSIDIKMSWDDNLRENTEAIGALLNGSK
jgi:glycosyltransferase involved in cell wall biosynthesis